MARFIEHRCRDHNCVCPVHKTDLIYWPAGDEHACQDPDCKYAHGYESVIREEMKEYWTSGPGSLLDLGIQIRYAAEWSPGHVLQL